MFLRIKPIDNRGDMNEKNVQNNKNDSNNNE